LIPQKELLSQVSATATKPKIESALAKDISYAVLALLNVFVLLKLSPIVVQETKAYFQKNSSESKGFYRQKTRVAS